MQKHEYMNVTPGGRDILYFSAIVQSKMKGGKIWRIMRSCSDARQNDEYDFNQRTIEIFYLISVFTRSESLETSQ